MSFFDNNKFLDDIKTTGKLPEVKVSLSDETLLHFYIGLLITLLIVIVAYHLFKQI